MNTNFHCVETDEFGDRADIALEMDRNFERIQNNKDKEFFERQKRLDAAQEYGTSSVARLLSEVVKTMIEGEVWRKLVTKSEIICDVNICEAVDDVCIFLGLDPEEEGFAPYIHDQGDMIEIRLL
jgi:hypothetical protein